MSKLASPLLQPIDNASLVAFRVCFGFVWVIRSIFFLASDYIRYVDASQITFHYWGFGWIGPPPAPLSLVVGLLLLVSSASMMLGAFFRTSCVAFFLLLSYFFFWDAANYGNLNYASILIAFWMIFSPQMAGQLSIDARRDPDNAQGFAPIWQLYNLRFLLFALYFYAGVAKLQEDWIRGEPLHTWFVQKWGDAPWTDPTFTMVQSWLGLGFDLVIAPALLWRKTRPLAFVAMILFHTTNFLLLELHTITWTMILLTVCCFVEPETPRAWWNKLRNARNQAPVPAPELPPIPSQIAPTQRALLIALIVFWLAQSLMPLRHWAYAGNARWNYHGQPFSWWLRTNSMDVEAKFYVVLDGKGRQKVNVLEHIHIQQKSFVIDPYQILQFAHHLKRHYLAQGYKTVEVYADVNASLNARKRQTFIKHDVNLAEVPLSFDVTPIVVPLLPLE